jgi:hypothetical protein
LPVSGQSIVSVMHWPPGAIVHAVYSCHQYTQQLDNAGEQDYLRDIQIAEHPPGEVYTNW